MSIRTIATGVLAGLVNMRHVCRELHRGADGRSLRPMATTRMLCTISFPCRTFGAAIAQTNAGGEVIVLDSAGYGPVTITQSVSIVAAPGVYAGISVSSGHGVTIATAATDTVVLRGLTISNQGSSGRGIYITGAGVVRIEDAYVAGFTTASGLKANPADVLRLHIRRSVFNNNATGIALNAVNGGVETMQIIATFADIEIANNGNGLNVGNNTAATLSHSIVTNNSGRGSRPTPLWARQAISTSTIVRLHKTTRGCIRAIRQGFRYFR